MSFASIADRPIPHSRPWLGERERLAVTELMNSGMIASGERAAAFLRMLLERFGCPVGRLTASGTSALTMALRAVGVTADADVVLPTYTCPAVPRAVLAVGARPVLCDIGDDWCLDPADVERKLTGRTGAVIAVDTFGIAAPVAALAEFPVPLIEDRAQSFTGTRPVLGRAVVCSFHATKPIAAGEGGAVLLTAGLGEAGAARMPEDDFRMADLLAAIGVEQVARFDRFRERRKRIAERFLDGLADLPIRLPHAVMERSLFFRFPIRTEGDVERLMSAFAERGIVVRRGVDTLLHRELGLPREDFPKAEAAFATTLSLPVHPSLEDADVDRVIEACRMIFDPRGATPAQRSTGRIFP